jgi:hypothetical protein
MSALQIADAIQSIGFLTYIRESGYTYPMIMATHLASIAVFGGLILATDLRLLGLAFTDIPVADIVRGLRPWKRLGFVVIVIMGLLLGLSEADKYYNNPYFWVKMFFLWILFPLHAIVFHKIYAAPEEIDRAKQIPTQAKAAAIASLVIWIVIPSFGRWIAYYEPPKENKNRPPVAAMLTTPTLVTSGELSGNQSR